MKNKRKLSIDKVFGSLNMLFIILVCFIMLYPLVYVLSHSLMSDTERALYPLRLIPEKLDLSGYRFILFSGTNLGNAYRITIMRTLIGTILNVAATALCAYPLSRLYYPARKALTMIIVFTMWFNGGMIPNFLLIKSLGLTNSFWVYILPGLVNPFNLIILRNFFSQMPVALEESAKLDGANDLQVFVKIALPLSKASIATIALFYAVIHWNTWYDAMLYVGDKNLWTVQYMLKQIIASASVTDMTTAGTVLESLPPAETVKMASIVVATVPILCVYPFLQKYFVKGVLVGSIK
jgi:putative aldouronate transport system permease protein